MRIGAAHSVDVADVEFGQNRIEHVHRPDQETTLKNGKSGERLIAITSDLTELLVDYGKIKRHYIADEYGRKPLLTTRQARMTRSSMRRIMNRITALFYLDKNCEM